MGNGSRVASVLCCPCRCVVCSLVSCALTAVACVVVVAGLVALALYLLFRPQLVEATAASAELANFTLAHKTWLLHYNLSLAVALRNPNRRLAIHYHDVAADALYQAQRFARADLPPFSTDARRTATVYPAFLGQHPLIGGVAAAAFRKEATLGSFSVQLNLSAKTRLKVWVFTIPGPKTSIECHLSLQRRNDSSMARPPEFHPTDCEVSF